MIKKNTKILLNPLLEETTNKAVNEISNYIINQYENNLLNPLNYVDILLYISEVLPYAENRDKLIEIGYKICKHEKQDLEIYGIEDLSMFDGLGYLCFAINEFCNKTKMLKKFSVSLNALLSSHLSDRIKRIYTADVFDYNYDLISGVSGLLYYLLDCTENNKNSINEGIQYLVDLTSDVYFEGNPVIKFHVLQKNQNKLFHELAPKGSINFGLAHGILGPLLALSKAFSKGIVIDGQKNAISKIFSLYEKFQITDKEKVPVWPKLITQEEYLSGDFRKELLHLQSSWCYGNIAIMRGLQKVAQYMDWTDIELKYKEKLIKFFDAENESYMLTTPSICHGYASILAVQTCAYFSSGDSLMLKNIERNVAHLISAFNKNSLYTPTDESVVEGYIGHFSLLTGSIGVGIALISLRGRMGIDKLLMLD